MLYKLYNVILILNIFSPFQNILSHSPSNITSSKSLDAPVFDISTGTLFIKITVGWTLLLFSLQLLVSFVDVPVIFYNITVLTFNKNNFSKII